MSFFNIDEELMSFAHESAVLNEIYIDFEIAMEEDMSKETTIDDATKKQKLGKVLTDKLHKLYREIIAIIDRLVLKLKNIFTRVSQTDEGFQGQIREAIAKNKPLEGIKLVVYKYVDSELESIQNKISDTVFKIIGSLKTSYDDELDEENKHPLDMKEKDLYLYVLDKAGMPKDVTDLNLLFEHMKKSYRKEKKETLFIGSNTREYYNIALSYKEITTLTKAKETLMRQQVSVLRTNLANITKNTQTQDSLKKKAMRQATNASLLYNFYAKVLSMYVELKLERILSYRIVLRKLYRL